MLSNSFWLGSLFACIPRLGGRNRAACIGCGLAQWCFDARGIDARDLLGLFVWRVVRTFGYSACDFAAWSSAVQGPGVRVSAAQSCKPVQAVKAKICFMGSLS